MLVVPAPHETLFLTTHTAIVPLSPPNHVQFFEEHIEPNIGEIWFKKRTAVQAFKREEQQVLNRILYIIE